jgi:hypothetical protein
MNTTRDEDQEQHAYFLYAAGKSVTAIAEKLELQGYENCKDPSTIRRWISKPGGFRDRFAEEGHLLDGPFAWHSMGSYELPWEAASEVLGIFRDLNAWMGASAGLPTGRQVIWTWRVTHAAPSLRIEDAASIAGAFVARAIRSLLWGEVLDVADLDACLAFAPWEGWPEDMTNAVRYEQAVEAGLIPKLREDPFTDTLELFQEFQWRGKSVEEATPAMVSGAMRLAIATRRWSWPSSTRPNWQLPSMVFPILIGATRTGGQR